jgi:hypothetical protein
MLVKRVLIPAMGLKIGRGHFRARKNEFIARPKGHIPIILSNSRSQYLSTSVLVGVSLPVEAKQRFIRLWRIPITGPNGMKLQFVFHRGGMFTPPVEDAAVRCRGALLAVKLNSNLLDRRIFENYNDHY